MTTADAETGLSLEAADNTNSTALFIREQFFYKNTPTSNFTDNLNYDNIYITQFTCNIKKKGGIPSEKNQNISNTRSR